MRLNSIKIFLFFSLLIFFSFTLRAQDAETIYLQGEDAFSKNDLTNAEKYYSDYIKKSPDSAKGYTALGNALLLLKKPEDAVRQFDIALQINPNFYKAYSGRGTANVYLGKKDDAFRDFNKAVEINPGDVTSLTSLGVLYASTGNNDKALEFFDKSLVYNSENPETYRNRGAVLFYSGDTVKALADMNKAVGRSADRLQHHLGVAERGFRQQLARLRAL